MSQVHLKRQQSDLSLDGEPETKKLMHNSGDYDDRPLESMDARRKVGKIDPSESVLDGGHIYSNKWQKTITEVVKAVVSIHFTHVSNFDTESSVVSEATGFVVDAERGLILTNRHVVGPGPFCGYAVFYNHEESVVKPIFRDPIHDFGVLQFDPKSIKYMEVKELELKPTYAQVGTEIRVIGNDAGEKLTILAGFISRLDRNAPDYGVVNYNDFNTEYIQAAASASGGSSGSPVVNEDGYVVALQAGGSTEASTDFFLPVFRPLRALKCIQNSEFISRGDIQVEWLFKPFDECRRLGLTLEAETRARKLFPDRNGLLVAEIILPEGPSDGKIKEGDTLISIDGKPISTFITVDEILDANVGKELEFTIERGGKEMSFNITIGNLHDITPDRYVEVTGASFNTLSYQVARNYCMPVRGVYINRATGSFDLSAYESKGLILESIDDKPTPDLNTFIEVMKQIPDSSKVTITYRHVADLHTEYVHVIYVERHWQSTFRLAVRNDDTGIWDFTDIQDKPLPPLPREPQNAKFIDIPVKGDCASLVRSFVNIKTVAPIPLDFFPFTKDSCYGVVVDAENGYVLVSRRFVPHDMCDVFIIFAESVEVPGKIVYLHPNLNYAILKYDPSLVLAGVKTPQFSDKPLKRGESAHFIGYNYNFRVVTEDLKVSAIRSLNVPASPSTPRYRGTNLECVILDSKLCADCDTGVLADQDGTIRAFWLSYLGEHDSETIQDREYRMGLDVTHVLDVIKSLKENKIPIAPRILDVELSSITVYQGKIRGVPQHWVSEFENVCDDEIKFLCVDRIAANRFNMPKSPLKTGDIILTVDGDLIKTMGDILKLNKEIMTFRIIRQKKEMELSVRTLDTTEMNTSSLVFWCGAIIQAPHFSVCQIMEKTPSEVYVTVKNAGGPAHQYGIGTNSFITHVNDKKVDTLTEFVKTVKDTPDNTYVKLRLVSFDNVPTAISIKTNYHYFPTTQLKKSHEGTWEETEVNKA